MTRSDAAVVPCAPRHRLLLAALLAALACFAVLVFRPAPASALTVGFLDPAFQTEQPDIFWQDTVDLGVGILRYDVYWRDTALTKPVNPRDPADPAYDWSLTDRLVSDAAAHQTEVVLTLWRTPAWARAQTSCKPGFYSCAPNLKAWGDFVYAAAKRYSGKFDPDGVDGPLPVLPAVQAWEMWNEPNYIGALRPQRVGAKVVSPKLYAGILNAGYAQVKQAGKESGLKEKVLGGAINRGFGGLGSVSALGFLRGMRAANAKFDVASIHPYPLTGLKGINDGTKAPNITLANFGDYIKELDRLWPSKHYRIWLTEYGEQSKPDRYGATLKGQATFVKQAITRLATKFPRVDYLVWFLIRDEPVELPGLSDRWQSGVRDVNGNKKPSYQAWVDTIATL